MRAIAIQRTVEQQWPERLAGGIDYEIFDKADPFKSAPADNDSGDHDEELTKSPHLYSQILVPVNRRQGKVEVTFYQWTVSLTMFVKNGRKIVGVLESNRGTWTFTEKSHFPHHLYESLGSFGIVRFLDASGYRQLIKFLRRVYCNVFMRTASRLG